MKKTILLLILSCFSAVIYAQKNVVVADSTCNSYNFGKSLRLAWANACSYNENCLGSDMKFALDTHSNLH